MRIRWTGDFDDEARRALNHRVGRHGFATRKQILLRLDGLIDTSLQQICTEWREGGETSLDSPEEL